MFEQLTQLVQQYGQDAVVKNPAVPNEQNEAVMEEAGSTILDGLKGVLGQSGGMEQLGGLLGGGGANSSNPIISTITTQLVNNLGSKFGIESGAASALATSMIPKVIGSLIGNANDPSNHRYFRHHRLWHLPNLSFENQVSQDHWHFQLKNQLLSES